MRPRETLWYALFLIPALLLAAGASLLGFVTRRALLERDRAVRTGELLVVAHEVESALRASDPGNATSILQSALTAHAPVLAGIELAAPGGVVAAAGTPRGERIVTSVALGPTWRGMAGEGGMRFRGSPPFRLRLSAGAALGDQRKLAALVFAGATAAGATLLGLAFFAARGLVERERRRRSESEKRELEIAALAGAGLAHRIRTPLATIKGTAQLLQSVADGAASARAGRIVGESERIDAMIRQLLEFAHPPEPQAERFDLAGLAHRIAARDANVRVSGEQPIEALADPAQIEIVLDELVSNARAFNGGGVEIELGRSGGQARVAIRDHGPGLGIDPDRAFDPYVSTRADGTGLGLSIARALARANRGELTLRNADSGGCVAELRLPAETR